MSLEFTRTHGGSHVIAIIWNHARKQKQNYAHAIHKSVSVLTSIWSSFRKCQWDIQEVVDDSNGHNVCFQSVM